MVDIDKEIDINKCTPNTRVALRNDSYTLHKVRPSERERGKSSPAAKPQPHTTHNTHTPGLVRTTRRAGMDNGNVGSGVRALGTVEGARLAR